METIGQRLRKARKTKGYTQEEVAAKLGVTRSVIAKYESGLNDPSSENLSKLATIYGVTTDYLLGHDAIGKIPTLNVGQTNKIPILGVIRAGMPIVAEQHIEGWEEVPEEWINGECFFLRVTGDSMVGARIQEGDLVFVRKQDYAENGDIVVVLVNGEDATVKRIFYTDDTIILHPENPKYKPMVFSGPKRAEVKVIGKVLWFKGTVL